MLLLIINLLNFNIDTKNHYLNPLKTHYSLKYHALKLFLINNAKTFSFEMIADYIIMSL